MKSKFLVLILLISVFGVSVYLYMYKGHRNIENETADFNITTAQLQDEFSQSDSLAYAKYQDKTIILIGKISNIDNESNSVVINEKMFATFKVAMPKGLKVGTAVVVKGRFLGYDDLLEEFKMDEITLIK